MKNIKIILLITCTLFLVNSTNALEGRIDYDSVYIDYSILKEGMYIKKGDNFLKKAENEAKTDIQKRFYYTQALGAYLTAIKINSESVETYGKIGYIYGKMDEYRLAKSYFNVGLNLQMYNPYVNFLFACFYAENQNYNNAIKYYKRAMKGNFNDKYSLYYNIGETNEKLGDLVKANEFYKKANAIKTSEKLTNKIRSIEDLKYNKSQYYIRKKLYYYD